MEGFAERKIEPFLATRTLGYIAENVKNTYPRASRALTSSFYVDFLIGGSHNLTESLQDKNELLTVTGQHHLELRKWTSNNQEFLK